ncbi:MAG: NAD-dependent epimerase/dehydratase family protein [Firmicutes bacterium]|nr:NAD-dependent epimerase/dehydratase family protein [Bacillota bacterium]
MPVVLITGSTGLIGSEAAEFYARLGFNVVGIDNDMRRYFFGNEGSTLGNLRRLEARLGSGYKHYDLDIRNGEKVNQVFALYKNNISLIIHTAAQPSHDWAAREPFTDFAVNANGTLNLLEAMRKHCPDAVFIFTSTNKVYGDRPNHLPLIEQETRFEIDPSHPYSPGIPEDMSVDQCLHSLFGASKLAADILVQEYGRYFHLRTCCFRGGVLSGVRQAGVPLHGFIGYLMKCLLTGEPYIIYGYKGKQVRDVISASDVISAFHAFYQNPGSCGEVYNLGGGRFSNISVLEAIELAQEITGKELHYSYSEKPRLGDHIWYISDLSKFISHYPAWKPTKNVRTIMQEIYEEHKA